MSSSTESPAAEARARELWHDLRELMLNHHDLRRRVADELGLSFNRVKALRRLLNIGPMTLRSLADHLVVDAPYATVIVDDLVRRGLAERAPNPADRRSKLVHLTAEGAAAAARANEIMDTPPPALATVPAADLAALRRVVDHLLADEAPAP